MPQPRKRAGITGPGWKARTAGPGFAGAVHAPFGHPRGEFTRSRRTVPAEPPVRRRRASSDASAQEVYDGPDLVATWTVRRCACIAPTLVPKNRTVEV